MNINCNCYCRLLLLLDVFCVSAVNPVFSQTVLIPEKTEVKVLIEPAFTTAIDPEKQKTQFKIAEPVDLFGVVVFVTADPVKASITEFNKRGHLGKPGKIAVTIEAIQAGDGAMIPVKPKRISHRGESKKTLAYLLLPLLGAGYFIKGGDAAIPQGDTVVVATKERHFFKVR